ncbi:MAG: cytochrome b/b6 domain-containing protein [Gammaproteobacteria bacterium]
MNATVKVWDPVVRVLHWSLAIVVLTDFIAEGGDPLHNWLGYIALFLIGVRFVWGWVGSAHARFSNWVRGPRAVRQYLRERLAGRSRRQLGHNPAAASMMVALLIGAAIVGITGWLQTTDYFFGTEWLEELHEVLAYVVLVMVGLHVLAAITESFYYRENLIASMLHGRKRALGVDEPDCQPGRKTTG